MNIQTILFPTDFSDTCHGAVKYVKALAQSCGAHVVLLHVAEDPLGWFGSLHPIDAVKIAIPNIRSESEKALKQWAEAQFAGTAIRIISEFGDPAERIEKVSADICADLITIPTHGRGRFRRLLLGSITSKTLDAVRVPVWTTVHSEEPMKDQHIHISKIVCGLDLNANNISLLRFAADFAKQFNAELHVAHGVPVTELSLGAYNRIQPPVYMEDFARAEIVKLQHEAGTSADVYLGSAPIAQVVREAALRYEADLVVIGRSLIAPHLGLLDFHTYAIIRDSPCPVLSVPLEKAG